MYSKFRTVASILVIAEFCIPFLGILALKEVVDNGQQTTDNGRGLTCPLNLFGKKLNTNGKINWLYVSFALTGGIAFLFAVAPTLFFSDFVSSAELKALSQFPPEDLNPLLENLKEIRMAIFTNDCWRSLIIIVLCTASVLAYRMKKMSAPIMVGIIAFFCLVDMWQVNKRYLNDDMFVSNTLREQPMEPTDADRLILQDKSLDYRVLNLASNTFNENETSFFHKSIGGYHAAKLRRYQDLIDRHIQPEMQEGFEAIAKAGGDMSQVNGDSIMPVINMLNAKYLILPLEGGKTMPLQNPYAMGNAWFVDKVEYVDNANAEIDALSRIDLHKIAVADKQFEGCLKESKADATSGTVKLDTYAPNELHYTIDSPKGGIVVFSEIYYPGWTCTVDGKDTEVGRVDYMLRAISVGPGKHKVVMEFKPKSITTTETVAYISLVLLILCIIATIVTALRKK